MQTPDQSRERQEKQQNWKVVASVAAATALGFSGLALASPDRAASDTPPAIELQDRGSGLDVADSTVAQREWEVVAPPSFTSDPDDSLDSPLASSDLDSPDTDDSPEDEVSATAEDSADVDDSPEVHDSLDVDDSPEIDDSADDSDD